MLLRDMTAYATGGSQQIDGGFFKPQQLPADPVANHHDGGDHDGDDQHNHHQHQHHRRHDGHHREEAAELQVGEKKKSFDTSYRQDLKYCVRIPTND